jgi:hypothetical protein
LGSDKPEEKKKEEKKEGEKVKQVVLFDYWLDPSEKTFVVMIFNSEDGGGGTVRDVLGPAQNLDADRK